jgi:heptosyltransferase I
VPSTLSGAMRILFVKTSSLGDVIHNCPAITDARRRFPEAAIDWVVEEPFAEIPRLHSGVSKVICVAIRRWRSHLFSRTTWTEIAAARREMSEKAYDVVIDTQGLLKSALITSGAHGAKHGYDRESAREPVASRFYDVRHFVPRHLHAVERNRALSAAALGIDIDAACDYGLTAAVQPSVSPGRPFCVLLTMTSRDEKLWPEARWIELAKGLSAQDYDLVLPWGTEAERARCGRIKEGAGAGLIPEALSLEELSGLMSQARIVIGVDTGLAHLAVALKVPTVGLYVSSDPVLTGLYGQHALINLGSRSLIPTVEQALESARALVRC